MDIAHQHQRARRSGAGSGRRRRAIADLVSTRLVKIPSWFTVRAALQVARLKRVEHLLVVDRRALVGTASARALAAAPPEDPVARWMTASTAWVSPDAPVEHALRMLVARRLECLPVVSGALLVGVVTRAALMGC